MIGRIIQIYKNKLRPRLKKILVGFVIFFVVFTLVGFFVIPPILKSILIKKLSENLHREVSITQIKVNPYVLSLTVRGFKVKDRKESETFVSFDELFVNLQSLSALKFALVFKEIRLTNPFVKISRHPDLSYNFSDLLGKKETQPPEKPTEKPKSLRFSLNNIRIENGSIDFWDGPKQAKHTVKELNIGLPFLSNIPSQIDIFVQPSFSAKVNETPYSGKYVGYTIEKGKLSFDLAYLINKKKLDSQNHIFLDQFTLGEKVESPQATKLPVKLAIALLKDRKGEIKLDIPVAGTLDDPKFSVWGIILKILVNLIAKAATSPFSLLGAIIGGGEELSFVEFEYGSSVVTEPSAKKLNAISKALNDRPSLKMDIEGHVDMEKDREGLKQILFNRKLNAQKLNEMVKKGQPAVPLDEVKIEKPEYGKYLKMAYKEEKFPKPRNVLGMAKDIPVPEMEKLILTHIEVREGDLRTLASQRAMKVKEAIVKSGQVEAERIFILEPKSLAPEKKEKLKNSRVDFKLK
ncbi:MAG: DUF748 domain-containing protein [Syntrophaceae bacterium]|nr:DUF748 domain-containing protein [Syntrophaceae bacterium]